MKSDDLNNKETNKLSINNFSNVLIKENNLCISETGSYINFKNVESGLLIEHNYINDYLRYIKNDNHITKFYGDLLFKVYSGFPLNIRSLFSYGSFYMENNTTNILVDKKFCYHKLSYENKINVLNKLHGFV